MADLARHHVRRAVLAISAALIAATLGWGYWHARTHGVLHVSVYDVGLRNDKQAYGSVLAAELAFTDASSVVLANARAETPLGVVSISHPQLGDCRREERQAAGSAEAMKAWRRCFELQSKWFMTWVPQVRAADVVLGDCTVHQTPVILEEFRNDWWLWWVPHPHLGGTPYTSFGMTLWVDSRNCRTAQPPR